MKKAEVSQPIMPIGSSFETLVLAYDVNYSGTSEYWGYVKGYLL